MYTSEEEQLEAIKRWWQENGIAVIVGLVIGLGGLGGWHAWQNYVKTRAENASIQYTQLMNGLDQGDAEQARATIDTILDEYAATPYAPLSALAVAASAVEAGQSDKAVEHLRWVIDDAEQGEFIPLARLRLARLHLAGGRLDEAGQLLDAPGYPDSYAARRAELRGDLHAARGDIQAARSAYETALNTNPAVQNRQMIQIKHDSLNAPDQAPQAQEEPSDA